MSKFSSADYLFMKEALREAAKGRFSVSPNPAVGCVIVKDNVIVGSGFHRRAGEAHAEIIALKQAGDRAAGASAYVTLEPCSHFGRTPPCADALVKAGVARVVAATIDPNPKVSGSGLEILKKAGIKTEAGLCRKKALSLNKAFFKSVSGGGPYVTAKVAASLDFKTALKDGQSRWITNVQSRRRVQRLRALSDAIITGVDTVITDNPRLDVRYDELPSKIRKNCTLYEDRQPLKVVLDSRGRLLDELYSYVIFSRGQSLIVLSDEARFFDFIKKKGLTAAHQEGNQNCAVINPYVKVMLLGADAKGRVDLKRVLEVLDGMLVRRVLIEAGPSLTSSFVNENLVDELVLFTAPKILGEGSFEALRLKAPKSLVEAMCFKLLKVKVLGDDVMLRYVRK